MMKTLKYVISALLLSAACVSCDDILDQTPKDKLTPDEYFKTATDLELFTNNFYVSVMPSASDIYDDNMDAIMMRVLSDVVSGQRIIPVSGGGWNWDALRQINFYLQHSDQCNDESARRRYDAVARFFRAFFYFNKVKRFGDCPWYDTVLDDNDEALYKPRDSREYVMQKLLEDVNYAISYLPTGKDVYRVTKWSALALKSRMCLYEGTFRKYHGLDDYEKYLTLCVQASSDFMTSSSYTLYSIGSTPYRNLFASLDAINTEIILARNYNAALSIRHGAQSFLNSQGQANSGLTKHMVDAYLMGNGTRFTDQPGWETRQFAAEMQNRDPRLGQTIRIPGGSLGLPNLLYCQTGYHLIKFYVDAKYDSPDTSENDMPVFRTAEVYLNYAEAKAELGTLLQEDIDWSIRLIRQRASMPNLDLAAANANPDPYLLDPETGYPNVTGPNTGVILEIRRERAIELIMEGFRYDDLMRWREGASAVNRAFRGLYFPGPGEYDLDGNGTRDVCIYQNSRPTTTCPYVWEIGNDVILTNESSGNILIHNNIPRAWNEARDYLYPIPSGERILNHALAQNPGWNDGLNF